MELHPLLLFVIVLNIVHFVEPFENNQLYGISEIGLTVSDLELATRFYTEIFGGMNIKKLSTDNLPGKGVFGDEEYYRIFQKEILEARAAGITEQEYKIPDISTNGDYKVSTLHLYVPHLPLHDKYHPLTANCVH